MNTQADQAQQQDTNADDTEQTVIDYLKSNPDFFERNPDQIGRDAENLLGHQDT